MVREIIHQYDVTAETHFDGVEEMILSRVQTVLGAVRTANGADRIIADGMENIVCPRVQGVVGADGFENGAASSIHFDGVGKILLSRADAAYCADGFVHGAASSLFNCSARTVQSRVQAAYCPDGIDNGAAPTHFHGMEDRAHSRVQAVYSANGIETEAAQTRLGAMAIETEEQRSKSHEIKHMHGQLVNVPQGHEHMNVCNAHVMKQVRLEVEDERKRVRKRKRQSGHKASTRCTSDEGHVPTTKPISNNTWCNSFNNPQDNSNINDIQKHVITHTQFSIQNN